MSEYQGKYNPRDVMGVEIEIGDTVAYPVRRQSSMVLKVGVVCEVNIDPAKLDYKIICLNSSGRRVTLTIPGRIAIVRKL